MEIKRDYYLNKIVSKMNNGLIKIITGIRRCGKSYFLFNIFKNYLLSIGIKEDHIIEIELDRRRYFEYHNPDRLIEYIESKMIDDNSYYLLIDEIQMCDEFESVLNDLIHIKNLDVYVTGSNSKLLSKDIITEFRGRGDEIHLNPLSFKEIYGLFDDFESAWNYYYTYGGMPFALLIENDDDRIEYLKNLFRETYLKDIKERNNIKGDYELEDLLNIISSSVGSLTNPTKICSTFKSSKNISISQNTIKQYLEYLEDAFIIKKSLRYDVKGKKYINTPVKYYFTDIGLRNARLNFRRQEENHIMENIIYNELNRRGYSIDVGLVGVNERQENGTYVRKQLECDFVVNKGNNRYYIQSAYSIEDLEKYAQEEKSLLNIKDNFKKIIISYDALTTHRNQNGTLIIRLFDFLLNPDSLEQ